MNRSADLRADYDLLGALLAEELDAAKAAALVRERRIVGGLLEGLEKPAEVTFVDEVGARRQSRTKASGAASRRRKSG